MDSLRSKYKVESIDHYLVKDWCLHKHYAGRVPSVMMHTFGLFNAANVLIGVCVFGLGGNNFNQLGFKLIELERLILNDGLDKNLASWFLSRCLRLLPKDVIVVTYTDTDRHCGYIFQATNWIYTGKTKQETKLVLNGNEYSRKKLWDVFGTSNVEELLKRGIRTEAVQVPGKHRYFYCRRKQKLEKNIIFMKFGCGKYPKGKNINSEQNKINIQGKMF